MAARKLKTIPIHRIPSKIDREVRKEMSKTNRNPEELLFEALARGGLMPVDLKARERRTTAVKVALKNIDTKLKIGTTAEVYIEQ